MSEEPTELELLLEQLDELLDEGVIDADDALELAGIAGLAERLGARGASLDRARAWRQDADPALVREALASMDVVALVAALDSVADGLSDDNEVDEALNDFDEAVAAAVWLGEPDLVRAGARHVAQMARTVPEAFAALSWDGKTMARTAEVAQDPGLYDYWLAIADAGDWAEE